MAFLDYRFCLLVVFVSTLRAGGFYLISDYYLDQSHSRLFGGICDKYIDDACAYLNSNINMGYVFKYGKNRDCGMLVDAGNMNGALHRIENVHFRLQQPDSISGDCIHDYVEFYDGPEMNETNLFGRFCGTQAPNFTGFPTQRYMYVYFTSDGSTSDTGFKFQVIRSEPIPCQDDEYHCTYNNRCIDGRLRCDGTEQCVDGQDESVCSGWEKFVGAFLRLGLGGLMAVGIGVFVGIVVIGIIGCCFTCCRRKPKNNKVANSDAEQAQPPNDSKGGEEDKTKEGAEENEENGKEAGTGSEDVQEKKTDKDEPTEENGPEQIPVAAAIVAKEGNDNADGIKKGATEKKTAKKLVTVKGDQHIPATKTISVQKPGSKIGATKGKPETASEEKPKKEGGEKPKTESDEKPKTDSKEKPEMETGGQIEKTETDKVQPTTIPENGGKAEATEVQQKENLTTKEKGGSTIGQQKEIVGTAEKPVENAQGAEMQGSAKTTPTETEPVNHVNKDKAETAAGKDAEKTEKAKVTIATQNVTIASTAQQSMPSVD